MAGQRYVRVDDAVSPSPLDYPGTPAPSSGVLDGDRFWLDRGPCPQQGRGVVLAVGSNAAPAVLAAKLRRAGVTGPVPMVRAEVEGLAVGHSAHVSPGGYVPAAPYSRIGTTETWALWLTDRQRAAVDVTEPNYVRLRLSAAEHPLRLDDEHRVAVYDVYASRWGVLGSGGAPLPLGTQTALHDRLAEVTELTDLAAWTDPGSIVRALADPAVRERVREAFVAAGWVVDAGLGAAGREGRV